MDLVVFDPAQKYEFTFDGRQTSLRDGDVILLKEVTDEERKRGAQSSLHFVRQNAFIRIGGAMGIRLDRVECFVWLAALIGLTHGYAVEQYRESSRAYRLVKLEPEPSPAA